MTLSLPKTRRRSRRWPLVAGLEMALLIAGPLLGAVGTLRPAASSDPGTPSQAPAGFEARPLFLLDDVGGGGSPADRHTTLFAYHPGGAMLNPILDDVSQPAVAPDGRQLFFGQVAWSADGAGVVARLVAMAADGLEPQWSVDLASFPRPSLNQQSLGSVGVTIVATAERVYAVAGSWGMREQPSVVVLNRTSGRELGRWPIELEHQALVGSRLYAAPDGQHLWLLAGTMPITAAGPQGTGQFLYLRFGPDGQLEERHPVVDDGGKPAYLWGSRLTADGHTLLQPFGYAPASDSGYPVRFFDLANGTLIPPLPIPFSQPRSSEPFVQEEAISHDGRLLYIFAPLSAELAVVDLQTRSLRGITPVDLGAMAHAATPSLLDRAAAAVRRLIVQSAAAKFYVAGDMQLSPDGRYLYAAGLTGSGPEARPNGVWAIDTTSWRVVAHWLDAASPLALVLDGSTLYARVPGGMGADSGKLWAIDTGSGELRQIPLARNGNLFTVESLFREQYGRSLGRSATVSQPFVPNAILSATVDPTAVVTGDRVAIEARFLDPRDGRLVRPADPGYRYTPPGHVSATLSRGDERVVVPLVAGGYGVYRGSTPLATAGTWSLLVSAERDDGSSSRALRESAVAVQQALRASDGRRYVLKLATDPARPAANQTTRVRLLIVDADGGRPLPEGVTLATPLPDRLDLSFFLGSLDEARGLTTVHLAPAGHGIYQGTVSFWGAGSWVAQLWLNLGPGQSAALTPGIVSVGAP